MVEHDWLLVFDSVSDEDTGEIYTMESRQYPIHKSKSEFGTFRYQLRVNDMEEEDAISLLLKSSSPLEMTNGPFQLGK